MGWKAWIYRLVLLGFIVACLYPVYQIQVVEKREAQQKVKAFEARLEAKDDGEFSIEKSLLKELGVLYVPSLDLTLPIYKGTGEVAITHGVGLIDGTGDLVGKNMNPVLTAHNGLTNSTLFMNLDKMKKGDPFFVKTSSGVREYKVISQEIVSPAGETFEKPEGRNLMTLRTCTPVFVNSHRLHVLGEEVPFNGAIGAGKLVFSLYEKILMGFSALAFLLFALSFKKKRGEERCRRNSAR